MFFGKNNMKIPCGKKYITEDIAWRIDFTIETSYSLHPEI